jgi:hypothetical protein
MANEPGAAVTALLGNIVDTIKSNLPARTDGKPLGGFIYSQLPLGMLVDRRDFSNPWTPNEMPLAQVGAAIGATPTTTSTPAPSGAGAGTAVATAPTAASPPASQMANRIESAYKTTQLVDVMLQVATDDKYHQYPTQRHLSFSYEGILNGMQAKPIPPPAPDVQKQIDAAMRVLYDADDDGDLTIPSKAYTNYMKNARAYANAKRAYTDAQAAALSDPVKAAVWPQDSVTFQETVDEKWNLFKTGGSEKVERALDTLESVGVPMQAHMIAKARKIFDAYNLGLAGVPIPIPYSYVEPSSWCDPDIDDDGWSQLTVSTKGGVAVSGNHKYDSNQSSHDSNSSSTSVHGGGSYFGFGASASHNASSADSFWQGSYDFGSSSSFKNDATDLEISLEYGLCTIYRPWLLSDLFYMDGWYLVGEKKTAISDGTIAGQAGKGNDPTDPPLMPLIPQQFLVIRNVSISSKSWGSDGQTLASAYGEAQGSEQSNSSSTSVDASFSLGFISLGGGGSHAESHQGGKTSGRSDESGYSRAAWDSDSQTLTIKGAQIIAYLSDVVPACPKYDDPSLLASSSGTATSTTATTPAPAAQAATAGQTVVQ